VDGVGEKEGSVNTEGEMATQEQTRAQTAGGVPSGEMVVSVQAMDGEKTEREVSDERVNLSDDEGWHTHTHTLTHTQIHAHTHIHTHTYTHTHTHTHKHTHAHTYVQTIGHKDSQAEIFHTYTHKNANTQIMTQTHTDRNRAAVQYRIIRTVNILNNIAVTAIYIFSSLLYFTS
jgi:ABC-type Zn2+ transport system substrate-binding protein/surface adhesin